jgi:hypothetical protein
MMMGSVGEIPQAPANKTMFVEDMSDSQLASAVSYNCYKHDSKLIYITYCTEFSVESHNQQISFVSYCDSCKKHQVFLK